ncbi:hypothetical protein pb186bvf_003261 [Paramecium bursaria]
MIRMQATLMICTLLHFTQTVYIIVSQSEQKYIIFMALLILSLIIQVWQWKQNNALIIMFVMVLNNILQVEINYPYYNFAFSLFYSIILPEGDICFIIPIKFVLCVYQIVRLAFLEDSCYITIMIQQVFIFVLYHLYTFKKEINKDPPPTFLHSDRFLGNKRIIDRQEELDPSIVKLQSLDLLRDGVIIFEEGLQTPVYVNRAAKNIFVMQNDQSSFLYNYYKLDNAQQDFKQSVQSIKSSLFDQRNKQSSLYSQQPSIRSKQKDSQLSPQSLSLILDKFYSCQMSEQLVYVQKGKKDSVIEVRIILNITLKKSAIMICRDLKYKQYINQLETYNRQKSKMISYVSHEYRAPVGCIIHMLEHVITQKKDEYYLQLALDQAKYLLNLSNNLLDLAQIKADKFQLNIAKFNFKQLCQECLDMFKLGADRKNIQLSLVYTSQCPSYIYQDSGRIKQILINLIGNAFKFTEKGIIQIIVSLENSNLLQVSVKDSGIGIMEEDKERLFKAFGKSNSEESKKLNSSGVGLGLVISNFIAKQLYQLGGLQFESQHLKGTEFYFVIQNHISQNTQLDYSEDNLNQSDEDQLILKPQYVRMITRGPTNLLCCNKILIVDDLQFNIDILSMLLKVQGYTDVSYAINGYLALEMMKNRKQCKTCGGFQFELIFMDLEMPGIDGLKTAELIFENIKDRKQKLPMIVACSGYEAAEYIEKCRQVGITQYTQKPIQKADLNKILDIYQMTKQ